MNPANWTTQFLKANGPDRPTQADGQGSGSADSAPAPPVEPRSLVGSRIGTYLITKRLGEGGVGEVFKGVDVMLKREVAIKVLRHELACDPLFVERFSREAQLHARLNHPNVASVHAFLHEGQTQFMVMEYVPGISLDEFVRSGGPVPVERALGIFRHALEGIEHAHRSGIVHRDIKPANIMLADSGSVKVMDFGIARAIDCAEHLTRHGQVAGTAKSLSPEQIRGREADVRSDIYSLGIVLYTLLAGRAPFDSGSDFALMKAQLEQTPPPLGDHVYNVPPEVEAAVMRALQKDPSARFQTVAEFARALDACLPHVPAGSPPPRSEARDAPTSSRTAVNPALAQDRPAPHVATGAAQPRQPRLRPSAAAARKPSTLGCVGGAISLALPALVIGAAFLWPRFAQREAPAAAAPGPVAVSPTVIQPPAEVGRAAPAQEPAVVAAAVIRRTLAIVRSPSANGQADATQVFEPGERVRLLVTPSHDAHVYCYLQDESQGIVRFYPNRFSESARVAATTPLEIPGRMRFELVANARKVTETVVCFASDRDVTEQLPASVMGTDFAKLPVTSLAQVRSAFARIATEPVTEARFQVQFK